MRVKSRPEKLPSQQTQARHEQSSGLFAFHGEDAHSAGHAAVTRRSASSVLVQIQVSPPRTASRQPHQGRQSLTRNSPAGFGSFPRSIAAGSDTTRLQARSPDDAEKRTMYTQEKGDAVCARVSAGESLRKAVEAEGVTHPTFLRWVSENVQLADQYTRARAMGADARFDDLHALEDAEPERGPSGTVDAGWVAWKRLQIDTAKWSLSKMAPKKYGDKTETTHELGDSVTKIVRQIVGV